MRNTSEDGGPAFPSHGSMGEVTHEGMTLRDYFAARAMEGELASQNVEQQWSALEKLAAHAYAVADAMLAARQR